MARASYWERKEIEVELSELWASNPLTLKLSVGEARSLLFALRDALRQAGEEV